MYPMYVLPLRVLTGLGSGERVGHLCRYDLVLVGKDVLTALANPWHGPVGVGPV